MSINLDLVEVFGMRVGNALHRAGIHTVEQVGLMSDEDLLLLRNVGIKSLAQIRNRPEMHLSASAILSIEKKREARVAANHLSIELKKKREAWVAERIRQSANHARLKRMKTIQSQLIRLQLTERQLLVMFLRDQEHKSLGEIAAKLGVSRARIAQIYRAAATNQHRISLFEKELQTLQTQDTTL